MIGGLLAELAGSAWVRAALRYGVTALAVLLFMLGLRRSVVLVIATSWLIDCAMAGFEETGFSPCPPVVEYSREFQAPEDEMIAARLKRPPTDRRPKSQ